LYEIWRKRKNAKGGRRFKPGMRRTAYIVKEKIRSGVEWKEADAPKTLSIGVQLPIGFPNPPGSCHSQIPMAAIIER
jgi:hypothetical protein